jgi:hypothetical protein
VSVLEKIMIAVVLLLPAGAAVSLPIGSVTPAAVAAAAPTDRVPAPDDTHWG